MSFRAYTGTSGYYYPDWKGCFYPPSMKKEEFLGFYSKTFNFCELNFSYYKMPEYKSLVKMNEQTPDDFGFAIKAFQSMTHNINESAFADLTKFLEACEGLEDKLVALVFQFPFSFHYDKPNRLYLDKLCKQLDKKPVFVEFRNSQWIKSSVFQHLSELGIKWIQPDLPKLEGLPGGIEQSPESGIYLRFHGRNNSTWWTGNNVSRYDYFYSQEELHKFKPQIKQAIDKQKILITSFNNHYKGQAVENAKMFKKLIDQALLNFA